MHACLVGCMHVCMYVCMYTHTHIHTQQQQHGGMESGAAAGGGSAMQTHAASALQLQQQQLLGMPVSSGMTAAPASGAAGWKEYMTPEGRKYYHDASSQTTQWDAPACWRDSSQTKCKSPKSNMKLLDAQSLLLKAMAASSSSAREGLSRCFGVLVCSVQLSL